MQDDEAIREFNRQRDHLEKQLSSVRGQLQKALSGSKGDINKIMDVSSVAHNLKNKTGLQHIFSKHAFELWRRNIRDETYFGGGPQNYSKITY